MKDITDAECEDEYKQALMKLKSTQVWQDGIKVRQWFEGIGEKTMRYHSYCHIWLSGSNNIPNIGMLFQKIPLCFPVPALG